MHIRRLAQALKRINAYDPLIQLWEQDDEDDDALHILIRTYIDSDNRMKFNFERMYGLILTIRHFKYSCY